MLARFVRRPLFRASSGFVSLRTQPKLPRSFGWTLARLNLNAGSHLQLLPVEKITPRADYGRAAYPNATMLVISNAGTGEVPLFRLRALAVGAGSGLARYGLGGHEFTHVTAFAAAQALGVTSLAVVAVVIVSLAALVRTARVAVILMAQLIQAGASMLSTLFTLVIFVVVIIVLVGHL